MERQRPGGLLLVYGKRSGPKANLPWGRKADDLTGGICGGNGRLSLDLRQGLIHPGQDVLDVLLRNYRRRLEADGLGVDQGAGGEDLPGEEARAQA